MAPGLGNKGILPLSGDNPYLGTNLFVAQQMEQSGFLFKFIQSKGGPRAIRLDEANWGRPILTLYYPESQESFVAEYGPNENFNEWMIRGPYPLSRFDYRYLRQINPHLNQEPAFVIFGQKWQFKPASQWENNSVNQKPLDWSPSPLSRQARVSSGPTQVVPEFIIPPAPRKISHKKPIKKGGHTPDKEVPSASPTPGSQGLPFGLPLNADQQAIALSRGFAERAANGDIIHTVKFDSESIKAIASWYTGSKVNEPKIIEVNKLTTPVQLKKGDRIKIPSALIVNSKIMSSDFYVE